MEGGALAVALFALRLGLNVSALLVIGLALHSAVGIVERAAVRRLVPFFLACAAVMVALAFGRLVILNLQMGDGSSLFDRDLMALAWLTLGPSTLAFAFGGLASALGYATHQRLLLGVAVIAIASGFALTGHTQALTDPALAQAGVALHAAIAGFWAAAPLTLMPRPTMPEDILRARLHRFSEVAVVVVPILLLLGLWLAWALAGGIDGLLGSPYGQLLLIKLAAAVIALGVGAFNQKVVTAKVAADSTVGRRWLVRTLLAEAILFAIAIAAISAATTLTGPGEDVAAE